MGVTQIPVAAATTTVPVQAPGQIDQAPPPPAVVQGSGGDPVQHDRGHGHSKHDRDVRERDLPRERDRRDWHRGGIDFGNVVRNGAIGGAAGGVLGGIGLLSKISLPFLGRVTSLAGVAKFSGIGLGIGVASAVWPGLDNHPTLKAALTGAGIGAMAAGFVPFVGPIAGAVFGAGIGVAVRAFRHRDHAWGNSWDRGWGGRNVDITIGGRGYGRPIGIVPPYMLPQPGVLPGAYGSAVPGYGYGAPAAMGYPTSAARPVYGIGPNGQPMLLGMSPQAAAQPRPVAKKQVVKKAAPRKTAKKTAKKAPAKHAPVKKTVVPKAIQQPQVVNPYAQMMANPYGQPMMANPYRQPMMTGQPGMVNPYAMQGASAIPAGIDPMMSQLGLPGMAPMAGMPMAGVPIASIPTGMAPSMAGMPVAGASIPVPMTSAVPNLNGAVPMMGVPTPQPALIA